MTELKPCPFCGGEAEIAKGRLYVDTTYAVKCKSCLCRTAAVMVDHPNLIWREGCSAPELDESTRYNGSHAMEIAAEAWNHRIEQEANR